MSEFSTAGEVELVVPDSEIRSIRQEIEDGLGSIGVGLETDGGTQSAQASRDAGGGRGRRRARREFRFARRRTNALDSIDSTVDDIERQVGDGGGGGGLLSSLLGGGALAGAGLLGASKAALAAAIGGAVGSTVGDVLGDTLLETDPELDEPVAVELQQDIPSLENVVDRSVTMKVPEPLDVHVLNDDDGVGLPELPELIGEPIEPRLPELPTLPLPSEDDIPAVEVVVPDEPLAARIGEEQLPLAIEPVEADVSVAVQTRSGGGGQVMTGDVGDGESSPSTRDRFVSGTREIGRGIDSGIGDVTGVAPFDDVLSQSPLFEDPATDESREISQVGAPASAPAQSVQAVGGDTTVEVEIAPDLTVNVDVDADLSTLEEDVLRETEREVESAVGELERRIDRAVR